MQINISDQNFLTEVEKYIGSPLQIKEDIKLIIKNAVSQKRESEFEELTFTAKYICGLMRVIKTAPGIPEISSIEQVKADLNENINKGVKQLKQLISSGSETEKNHFDKTYFTLSASNFSNLSVLFSDLESVKKYLNNMKRQA